MSKTISVRIKGSAKSAASGQRKHDLREGKQPSYIDANLSYANSIIIAPFTGSEIKGLCEIRRTNATRRIRSNAYVATNGIITFGYQAQATINRLTPQEQDKMFQSVSESIAKKFNNTLTGLVVHRDESAIHAHFQMPAVNRNGCPNSKERVNYSELQDIAGDATAYLGITRGISKAKRMAAGEPDRAHIHRSVKQLHEDLPRELAGAINNHRATVARLEDDINNHTTTVASLEATEKNLRAKMKVSPLQLKPVNAEIVVGKTTMGRKKTALVRVFKADKVTDFIHRQQVIAETYTKLRGSMQNALNKSKEQAETIKSLEKQSGCLLEKNECLLEKVGDLELVLYDRGVMPGDIPSEIKRARELNDDGQGQRL
ncbi:MAG: hypothetical protein A6F72_02425 [Cycloclasticus sp. symbiont of Poecilosclerida sp. N]|nr:MAG: hypothetical protein A6F72_02425 [Cycloclasticus sp. symbiont of Poecilosclerida sp. N]